MSEILISGTQLAVRDASSADAYPESSCSNVTELHAVRKGRRRHGNYGQIRPLDVANGEGIRVSIFVTGCTHACPGCFNADYQKFNVGKPWTQTETDRVVRYLSSPVVSGLTLLGGEPMQNLWLTDVVREIRERIDTNIWVYSGYTYEQIISHSGRRELLEECDVLVDGLFIEALKDLRLKFRGSSNQRIIDVSASRRTGSIQMHAVA